MLDGLIGLLKTRTASRTFTLFFGSLASKAAAFFALFWLASALDRSDYDLFAMVMTIAWFVYEFTELGARHSIVRHAAGRVERGETGKAAGLFRLAAAVKAAIWLAVLAAAFALSGTVDRLFLDGRGTTAQVMMAAAAGVGLGVIVLETGVFHSFSAFGRDVAVNVAQNGLKVGALAALALFSAISLDRVIAVFAAAPWAAALLGLLILPRGALSRGGADREDVSSVMRYGPALALIVLLSSVHGRVGIFLLKALSGTEGGAADFFIAQHFSEAFLFMLVSYQSVMFSKISAIEDQGEVLRVQWRSMLPLALFACGVLCATAAVGPAVSIALPAKYAASAPAARWLLAGLAAAILGTPPMLFFMHSKQLRFIAAAHVCGLCAHVALCTMLAPRHGAAGVAASFAASQALHNALLWAFLAWARRAGRRDRGGLEA